MIEPNLEIVKFKVGDVVDSIGGCLKGGIVEKAVELENGKWLLDVLWTYDAKAGKAIEFKQQRMSTIVRKRK